MHHTVSLSCVVAVVISTFATIVVVVVLLSSSADKNIWCVGGAVPWGGKNYNDTTTKNLSEVTVVSPRYDESYQTRTSNAVIQTRRIHAPQTCETSLQTSLRSGGWSESTVAG